MNSWQHCKHLFDLRFRRILRPKTILKLVIATSCLVALFISLKAGCKWVYFFQNLTPSSPSWFVSSCHGRIGNQISSFATLLAMSKRYQVVPHLTGYQAGQLARLFDFSPQEAGFVVMGNVESTLCSIFWENRLFVSDFWEGKLIRNGELSYDFGLLESSNTTLLKGRYINIGDYTNEVTLFKSHLASLRNILNLRKDILEEAKTILEDFTSTFVSNRPNLRQKQITPVCLHIRGVDYHDHLALLYGLEPVNASYFTAAMELIKQKVANPMYVIVSQNYFEASNMLTAREDSPLSLCSSNCFVVEREEFIKTTTSSDFALVDFALLTLCHHHILTYGTFGMWGALLSSHRMESNAPSLVLLPKGYERTKEVKEIVKANLANWIFV